MQFLLGAAWLAVMMTVQVYNGRENQVNVRIPRIEADATVDGVINEPVWQQAALLTGFSEFSPHGDYLFSYQPTPGTVVFAGYSSLLTEPEGPRFGSLRRTNDGFFLKVSYLFRL